ncbi:hypothetical protein M408DRAFT_28959 [Serendipita vermifera MAFF 305830]|uniref:Uncharacterized protein n=1 Tax=Serendipita vermifera MAFF 305830 TaxID=933852 RepID=A0A0C3AQ31_SERVB|nr:hypothetical protein M408DRAFT_28959 [Serendipita vermifera MAFF 305830]
MSATFLTAETTRGSTKSSPNTTEISINDLFRSDFQIISSSAAPHSSIGNAATPYTSSRLHKSQSQERPLPPAKVLGKRLFGEEDTDDYPPLKRIRTDESVGLLFDSGIPEDEYKVIQCWGQSSSSRQIGEARLLDEAELHGPPIGANQGEVNSATKRIVHGSSLLDQHYRDAFRAATGVELDDWDTGLEEVNEISSRDSGSSEQKFSSDSFDKGNHIHSASTAAVDWQQDMGEEVDFEEVSAEYMRACSEYAHHAQFEDEFKDKPEDKPEDELEDEPENEPLLTELPRNETDPAALDAVPVPRETPFDSEDLEVVPISPPCAPARNSGGKWKPGQRSIHAISTDAEPATNAFRYTAAEEKEIWRLASRGDFLGAHALFDDEEQVACVQGPEAVKEYMTEHPEMRLRRKKNGRPHDKLYICRATAVWKGDGTVEYREKCEGPHAYSSEDIYKRHVYEHHLTKPRPSKTNGAAKGRKRGRKTEDDDEY